MAKPTLDIWQFETALSARLMQWTGFTLTLGAPPTFRRDAFWRGFGLSCVSGSLITGTCAWFEMQSGRRSSAEDDAHTHARQSQERAHLARLLWLSVGIDLACLAGGLALVGTQRRKHRFWRGAGWGVLLQSAGLFLFDLAHALPLTDLEEQ